MVAVMSPNYFSSDWCAAELRLFRDIVRERVALAPHVPPANDPEKSIFRVFANQVTEAIWPAEYGAFDASRGYAFFKNTERGVSRFYQFGQLNHKQEYFHRMEELVQDIAHQLKVEPARPLRQIDLAAPQVVLTASDEDVLEYAYRLGAELKRRNKTVVLLP